MRRLVLLLLLACLVAPATGASAAQACDVIQVETLETVLPEVPATLPGGRTYDLSLTITRGGQPAADVEVFATLRGVRHDAYKGGVTGADGTAVLRLAVPVRMRGAVELDVEAYRELVDLPCAGMEEYDRNATPWGRVV